VVLPVSGLIKLASIGLQGQEGNIVPSIVSRNLLASSNDPTFTIARFSCAMYSTGHLLPFGATFETTD